MYPEYIHVNDLADAHIKAPEYLKDNGKSTVFNLGTGNGYSIFEIIDTTRKITGVNIKRRLLVGVREILQIWLRITRKP